MDDLTAKTDEELTVMNQELGRQMDALRERRVAIMDELRRRHPPGETAPGADPRTRVGG